jgi:hypothetical protein
MLACTGLLLGSLAGCNSNDTNITAAPTTDLSMELVPAEGPTEASTDPDFDWMVSLDLVLTEGGGEVGATVDQILVEIAEAQNGISLGSQAGDTKKVVLDNPSDRIEPGESLTIGIKLFYSFASGGREILADVTVIVTDDNSYPLAGAETFHGLP